MKKALITGITGQDRLYLAKGANKGHDMRKQRGERRRLLIGNDNYFYT